MVTENSTAPFSVIAPQRGLQDGLKVFKLFSSQPLWSGTLDDIFQNLTVLEDRLLSWPFLDPTSSFSSCKVCTAGGQMESSQQLMQHEHSALYLFSAVILKYCLPSMAGVHCTP